MDRDSESVREVLSRYVRATDSRDGAALARLFAPDGKVQMFYGRGQNAELVGELEGHEALAHAVGALMAPHPVGGWSHHTTHDAIVTVEGDRATIDAQYVAFNVQAAGRPKEGWPSTARGAQGTVTPIESGYYRAKLARIDGAWKIATHRIEADLPFAFPQGA
jgi:hypothetical protein